VGKGFQARLDEYKDKPKVENLNEASPEFIDDDYYQIEPMFFSSEGCVIRGQLSNGDEEDV